MRTSNAQNKNIKGTQILLSKVPLDSGLLCHNVNLSFRSHKYAFK